MPYPRLLFIQHGEVDAAARLVAGLLAGLARTLAQRSPMLNWSTFRPIWLTVIGRKVL